MSDKKQYNRHYYMTVVRPKNLAKKNTGSSQTQPKLFEDDQKNTRKKISIRDRPLKDDGKTQDVVTEKVEKLKTETEFEFEKVEKLKVETESEVEKVEKLKVETESEVEKVEKLKVETESEVEKIEKLNALSIGNDCKKVENIEKAEKLNSVFQPFQQTEKVEIETMEVEKISKVEVEPRSNKTQDLVFIPSEKRVALSSLTEMDLTQNLIQDLVSEVQTRARSILFPTTQKVFKPSALVELLILSVLSGCCLCVLAGTIGRVDESLVPALLSAEAITMVFSMMLPKFSGAQFGARCCVIGFASLLSTAILVQSIMQSHALEMAQSNAEVRAVQEYEKEFYAAQSAKKQINDQRRVVISAEIKRIQSLVSDLQARERLSQAAKEGEKLTLLLNELKTLEFEEVRFTPPKVAVAKVNNLFLQIALRLLLNFALILLTHQIGHIIVNRRWFTSSTTAPEANE